MKCPKCQTPGHHYERLGYFQCPSTTCGHSWFDGTKFHSEATCGSCNGPLEIDRDAVCRTCSPEPSPVVVIGEPVLLSPEVAAANERMRREKSEAGGKVGDAAADLRRKLGPEHRAEVDAWLAAGSQLVALIPVVST